VEFKFTKPNAKENFKKNYPKKNFSFVVSGIIGFNHSSAKII
jgi:hypothetical protein